MNVYRVYKAADENVRAKILIIEAMWFRTAEQIEFVKRVANILQEEHCRIHFEIFETLKGKLMSAISKIEAVLKKSDPEKAFGARLKKWKFVLVRESIDETISELERWQRIFDPTWLLILRVGDEGIDTELSRDVATLSTSRSSTLVPPTADPTLSTARSLREMIKNESSRAEVHVSLSEDGLDWDTATVIPYSNIRIVQRPNSGRIFAVDSIACGSDVDVPRARADAETLAKKLKQVDPSSCNLLSCQGLIKLKDPRTRQLTSIDLVFRLPSSPTLNQIKPPELSSLRQQLLHTHPSAISLTQVLNIARHLARAVSTVHTCEFVHKNIRPETILILPDENNASIQLGSAQLLGFDSFRGVYFHTNRLGDPAWERNLYRHPQRQGIRAHEAYVMQHDLYSLGVCLLELGLWTSFLEYCDGDDDIRPSSTLGLKLDDFDYCSQLSGTRIKEHLVRIAKSRLPARMGDRYAAVVVTCLTCLDPHNEDFGDPEYMRDEDGILIGVRFIEKVLLQLGNISF